METHTLIVLAAAIVAGAAENCVDLQHAANGALASGTYTVTNSGQSVTVYCMFYAGYGYTFLSSSTSGTIDMTSFYDDTSHVKVHHKRANGAQYSATIQQLNSHASTPISVQFNTHTGYQGPQNSAMTPYIFVGFIPASQTYNGAVEGWKVNGNDHTFTNCDGNPNSYIVFLMNHANAGYTSYAGGYNSLMWAWYDMSSQVSSSEVLPDEFFTGFYEIHHGGCGGYGKADNVPDVTGATVGLKFVTTCATPDDVSYARKSVSGTSVGSTVTYTCNSGYSVMSGDVTRTCSGTGGWSGTIPVCGVHGNWAAWSSWAGCSVTCASGTWSRSRTCTDPAPTNGNDCAGSSTESGTCTLTGCPVDGAWVDWSSWGSCDVTCGGGSMTRTRSCSNPVPANGGQDCAGVDSETTNCNDHNCPIDGGWDTWSTWSSCPVTCGGATVSRSRSCTNPAPQYNGTDCVGDDSEVADCNTNACPVDGAWTDWSSWGSCDVTCGGGSMTRTRSCSNPAPANGGLDCTGVDSETTNCNDHNCPIDGGWDTWSTWSSCPVTCGGATVSRSRSCTNPAPQYNGTDCVGDDSEVADCSTNACPVDGAWTDWSSWGSCDVTCGGGSMTRTRSCSNPAPAYGGLDCQGDDAETAICNDHNCPIDGDWGAWTTWTSCPVTCGTGSISRSRSCDSPAPQFNGSDCAGSDTETSTCTLTNCPVDGGWGSWTYTTSCSVTCGYGERSRARSCDSPAPAYGGANCTGSDADTEQCMDVMCPPVGSAVYANQCGSGYFTCNVSSPICIPEVLKCDCADDCDDGSDEDTLWGECDPILTTVLCSSADSVLVWRLAAVLAVLASLVLRLI